ncbi:MAG: tetratricopeptide repeat protein [Bryobacteraceae bacterium]
MKGFAKALLLTGFVSSFCLVPPASAKERWTELNIGPFYVDTAADAGSARDALTQLEQLRWVLGGLLESKDLPSVWPIRVMLTRNEKTNPTQSQDQFVSQNGQYVFVSFSSTNLPLEQVAGILLDANTPRLPPEVESGLRQLFSTLEAHGSRVTWGGPPARPDLDWARMQLFATKFEYGSSFHIFINALRGGSTLRAAERNAFGKDSQTIEQEANTVLASHQWQSVPVSGRPLDPKRDFGEHSLDGAVAAVYLADVQFSSNPKAAEAAYKSAIEAGGPAVALGYEGLAQVAKRDGEDPKPFFESAMKAGSKNASVYVAAAEGLAADRATPLLKRAAQLNPLWAEPVFRQAQLTSDLAEREVLLKKAVQLDPRSTRAWLALADTQTANGHAAVAQGTWLRAEESTVPGPERDRLHQLRLSSEQERLNAAETARRRERETAQQDDERAQQAEAHRIRAAEEKANQQQEAAAGGVKPEKIVPWEETVRQRRIQGRLIRVDCLRASARIWVKDKAGKIIQLFLKEPGQLGPACGPQPQPRRVLVAYSPRDDDRLNTAGDVVSITFQ